MSMQTLTWDVDAAAVAAIAGNSDAYGLALATQARQKQQTSLKGKLRFGNGSPLERAMYINLWQNFRGHPKNVIFFCNFLKISMVSDKTIH